MLNWQQLFIYFLFYFIYLFCNTNCHKEDLLRTEIYRWEHLYINNVPLGPLFAMVGDIYLRRRFFFAITFINTNFQLNFI